MTATAVSATELRKTYPGDVTALDGLSFSVGRGEIFGMLGPNGAGKSTTIRILTTLSRPDSGRATVAGADVLSSPDEVRHRIGVVAQGSGVDPVATGRENLTLQGRVHGMSGQALRRRVDELLDRFRLAKAADRPARTYSGGMQRRLDIALGMIHSPQVLFLDEPTTGLDPEVRADMWEMIRQLVSEDGLTVVLTTHYMDEADRLADRVAIVDGGRVVAEGTPEGLKADLEGDAVHIELAGDEAADRARDILTELTANGTQVDGQTVRARVRGGAEAVPRILTTLDGAGIGVRSVTVSRPSLDDVYFRHTGRSLAGAEEGEEQ
jgi:ABC-2 type transport system ATP-binding protein